MWVICSQWIEQTNAYKTVRKSCMLNVRDAEGTFKHYKCINRYYYNSVNLQKMGLMDDYCCKSKSNGSWDES